MKKYSILITGASSGIGYAIAKDLTTQGHQVFIGVRTSADAARVEKEIPKSRAVMVDVTDLPSIDKAYQLIEKELLPNHEFVLVNNAGIAVAGPIEAIDLGDFKQQFDVNVFGLVAATQVFMPLLRQTRGKILNVSSVSGLYTTPFLGAYSASKYAVEAISDALRRELIGSGVKICIVEPGPFKTPIWSKGLGNRDATLASLRPDRIKYYQKAFDIFMGMVERRAEAAQPVAILVDAIRKILMTEDPPLRTIVTSPAGHLELAAAKYLPAKWIDNVVRKQLFR